MPGKLKDLANQEFGYLTVIKFSHMVKRHSYWKCECNLCGTFHYVRSDCLKSGLVKSCGCLNYKSREHTITHNKSKTKLYRVFYAMKQRCFNNKDRGFKWYGARGITICDEWNSDFKEFYNWAINNGYEEGLQIDRINNNGNYEPSNCRWVTRDIQANNKRQRSAKNVRCNDYPEREYINY